MIAENGGGSGVFVNLEVVLEQDGVATTMTSTLLGDRVTVNQLSIANNQITVEMITQGPTDPMCCPTQQVTQVYELKDDQLVLVSETKGETATASPLTANPWVWTGTIQNDSPITTPTAARCLRPHFQPRRHTECADRLQHAPGQLQRRPQLRPDHHHDHLHHDGLPA